VNTITATVHLQKANDIGGISEDKPLATIKFPDQIAVASKANKKPKVILLFFFLFKDYIIYF